MLKRGYVLTLTFVLVVTAGQLVGCGQKGPLYLPAPVEAPADKSAAKPEKTEPTASAEQQVTK